MGSFEGGIIEKAALSRMLEFDMIAASGRYMCFAESGVLQQPTLMGVCRRACDHDQYYEEC